MGAILFRRHRPVALITIDRQEAMNALDFAAHSELIGTWERVRDDAGIRAADKKTIRARFWKDQARQVH